eukprot:4456611-Amphidinium_carterae.1
MAKERCVRYTMAGEDQTACEIFYTAIMPKRRLLTNRWTERQWPTTIEDLAALLSEVGKKQKSKGLRSPVVVIDEINRMTPKAAQDLVFLGKVLKNEAINL